MTTMTRWEKFRAESRVYGFDFTRLLEAGETITSAAFAATVVAGTDPTPGAIVVGSADVAGPVCRQRLAGGLAGVLYRVTTTVSTSAGNTLQGIALLQVS
jgi:hypothetical protein